MSRNAPTELEQLILELPCAYCNAQPGVWCVTASGRWPGQRWAIWMHADREWIVREAWRVGYMEHASSIQRLSRDELLDWHDWSNQGRKSA